MKTFYHLFYLQSIIQLLLILSRHGGALITSSTTTTATATTGTNTSATIVDVERLQKTIANGQVYQQFDFLDEDQVQVMINDIERLREENIMRPSGLSNTLKKSEQNFGDQDRTTAPAPWWNKSLQIAGGVEEINSDYKDGTCQEQNNLIVDPKMQSVIDKIQSLRKELSFALNRPTMNDATLAHECYYSRSVVGAFLPRHMDERHEELKGPRGWMLPSRRSISWLIYLSDIDLVGGELRVFPQQFYNQGQLGLLESGSDNGNLQVGWIDMKGENDESITYPVYLDSWFNDKFNLDETEMNPKCILYTTKINNNKVKETFYVTKPWNNDMIQKATSDFLIELAEKDGSSVNKETILFISNDHARSFRLLEDREAWTSGPPPGSRTVDIIPKRGSLVMFDSVSVPHEVLKVQQRTRAALAGWFHEETQQFPISFS